MHLHKFVALACVAVISLMSCSNIPKPKFTDVAELLCDGLEDFDHLKNGILSVHLLIERGDYVEALKVAYALLASFNEDEQIEGVRELRALIFLLESMTKGSTNDPH